MKSDQWMIDVLTDLQRAANERGLHDFSRHLGMTMRVAQEEIANQLSDLSRSQQSEEMSGDDSLAEESL